MLCNTKLKKSHFSFDQGPTAPDNQNSLFHLRCNSKHEPSDEKRAIKPTKLCHI